MTARRGFLGAAIPALAAAAALFAEPPVSPDSWPRWRGPFDSGMAAGEAPTRWSDTENIKWKVDVPGRGHSSPVIWGERIFLTTAVSTQPAAAAPRAAEPGGSRRKGRRRGPGGGAASGVEHKLLVLCFDRDSGKTLWRRTAAVAKPHEGYHRTYGSFASNSPVTDGEVIIAFFGSRGVYAYDLDGNLKWKKSFPPMRMRHGFGEGIAPVLDGNVLLLTFDHEGDSFILALDKSSGEELWRRERDEISNWAAPLVVEYRGRKQAVVAATNMVRSYDLLTGELIWESAGLGVNTIPAPVSDGEMVWVMSGYRSPNLLAIRLGGKGDLTDSDSIVWTNQRGNSYTPSPVLHDGKLYLLTDRGFLSCFNAKTGEAYYQQQRLPKPYSFKASPVGAAGKLYLATEDGDVVVVKMGEQYEPLATNTLTDEFFVASPAIVGGEMFLRGKSTLYCIRDEK